MVDQSLVERKVEASRQLTDRLTGVGVPLLAAYWEWDQERSRWIFFLVPKSKPEERELVNAASKIMIEAPYRSVFSLADVVVDGTQIDRARAIGAYVRRPQDIGRQFETTFTGGQYFEAFVVIYLAPEVKREPQRA